MTILCFCIVVFVIGSDASADDVTLMWDPNSEPFLGGYNLKYGTSSGNYTTTIDVGNVTTYTVTGLVPLTTYFFVVTAYDDIRAFESSPSNEVSDTPGVTLDDCNAPNDLSLFTYTVNFPLTCEAGGTIRAGDFQIGASGNVTFRAGEGVRLYSGVITEPGGELTCEIDPSLQTSSSAHVQVDRSLSSQSSESIPFTPLVSGFRATTTAGRSPLTVTFTDTSAGNITRWAWDFEDGTTSSSQHPNHTYVAPGTYVVLLTLSGPHGMDTSAPVQIEVSSTDPSGQGGSRGSSEESVTSEISPARVLSEAARRQPAPSGRNLLETGSTSGRHRG